MTIATRLRRTLHCLSTRGRPAPLRPPLRHQPKPEVAEPLYDRFCERLEAKKGVFGACMGVALINDGPVTLMLEIEPPS